VYAQRRTRHDQIIYLKVDATASQATGVISSATSANVHRRLGHGLRLAVSRRLPGRRPSTGLARLGRRVRPRCCEVRARSRPYSGSPHVFQHGIKRGSFFRPPIRTKRSAACLQKVRRQRGARGVRPVPRHRLRPRRGLLGRSWNLLSRACLWAWPCRHGVRLRVVRHLTPPTA